MIMPGKNVRAGGPSVVGSPRGVGRVSRSRTAKALNSRSDEAAAEIVQGWVCAVDRIFEDLWSVERQIPELPGDPQYQVTRACFGVSLARDELLSLRFKLMAGSAP